METPQASAELSFDKATYMAEAGAGPPCANCNGALGDQYWQWQSRAICESCRGRVASVLEASQSKKAFGRAALLGGATALGCGIAYAIFVAVTDYQLALVTIAIAFLIAKVMRRCSAGIGGRKFQILAVALTYLASAMGYAPAVWSGLREASATHQEAKGPKSAAVSAAVQEKNESSAEQAGLGGAIVGVALIFAFTLAAPILAATDAPIGLLIVGFGLWEAWKLSRGVPLSLDGPYRVAPAATGPPAA